MRTTFLAIAVSLLFGNAAFAQASLAACGEPPTKPPSLSEKEFDTIKGTVAGELQTALRFLGNAEAQFDGEITSLKETINQEYDDAGSTTENLFILYIGCTELFSDDSISTSEKFDLLIKLRAALP